MAKSDLISGSIWDEYSNEVVRRMNNPQNKGEITEERAKELGAKLIIADFGAESCGDAVRLYWAVDESTDKIVEAKFLSFGCFTSNTWVNTPTKRVQIKDLKVGDKVITWNGLEITENTIEEIRTTLMEKEELQKTTFIKENGKEFSLISSKKHPYWNVKNELQLAEDLKVGDELFEITEKLLKSNNGMKITKIESVLGVVEEEQDLIKEDNKIVMHDLVLEENGNGHVYFTDRVASHNCGTAISSSDVMAELCIGKTVDEAIKITNIDVEHALRDNPDTPAVPPQKMHCSVMAYDVIKKAAATYKGVDMESFETEEIICECARVSLGTIQEVIKINNLTTIEQITDYTKAGAFCKSCVKPGGHEEKEIYLVDILENSLNNNEVETNNTSHFNDLTTVQQIREIESILDRDIRPMLAMDGGNIELIDIKQNNGKNIIYVRYLGACSGCSSGDLTLGFIEEKLKQELQEDNLELIYT